MYIQKSLHKQACKELKESVIIEFWSHYIDVWNAFSATENHNECLKQTSAYRKRAVTKQFLQVQFLHYLHFVYQLIDLFPETFIRVLSGTDKKGIWW